MAIDKLILRLGYAAASKRSRAVGYTRLRTDHARWTLHSVKMWLFRAHLHACCSLIYVHPPWPPFGDRTLARADHDLGSR
jgi:hypothetical protein